MNVTRRDPKGRIGVSYDYGIERGRLFTEDGQTSFLKVRDKVNLLLANAGAVMSGKVIGEAVDTWLGLAVLDRMVELGEIQEWQHSSGRTTCGQHRIFTLSNERLAG